MFGIGLPELLLILALALIVVGPDKLPELARSIAKTIVDLKKTAEGLKGSLELEDNPLSEIKPELEDAARNFKESVLDAETHTWKNSPDENSNESENNINDLYDENAKVTDEFKRPSPASSINPAGSEESSDTSIPQPQSKQEPKDHDDEVKKD